MTGEESKSHESKGAKDLHVRRKCDEERRKKKTRIFQRGRKKDKVIARNANKLEREVGGACETGRRSGRTPASPVDMCL